MRKSNLYLINSLTEKELNRSGTASERQITVRALLFVMAGHIIHHISVIKERYL
ncbi:DinB family protein [Pedobacter steynii]